MLVTTCNVCGSTELASVFETQCLPLTGIYLPQDKQHSLPVFEQGLKYCRSCGHGQLSHVIDPKIVYDDTYTHRSSVSPISTSGNDFFAGYLQQIRKKETFDCILEVGCNDLYLAKKIQNLGESIVGIDPIWIGKDHNLNDKTKVIGCFVEDLQDRTVFDARPDLIISSHTFEHIARIYDELSVLVELAADGCQFLIEMPCFDTMSKIKRFDQVFHQHIQYLSLSSMSKLIERLGCRYLSHTFNFTYWGGTLLFSFEKSAEKAGSSEYSAEQIGYSRVVADYQNFNQQLEHTLDMMTHIGEKCYGFGAAQMLPTLAHYMGSDLSFLNAILDDNPARIGTFLPEVAPPILSSNAVDDIADSVILVTALDSARPIIRRAMELSARRIVLPINIL